MDKPQSIHDIDCTKGYNFTRVGEATDRTRRVCMFLEHTRKEVYRDLVHSVGGGVSDGLCQNHYDNYHLYGDDEEETKKWDNPDGGPRRWRLDDLKSA